MTRCRRIQSCALILLLLCMSIPLPSFGAEPKQAVPSSGGETVGKQTSESAGKNEFVQKNIKAEFSIEPSQPSQPGAKLMEGNFADVTFRISDATTNAPLSAMNPIVWIDLHKTLPGGKKGDEMSCKDKVDLFFKGTLTFRPDIDLNTYYILSMNNDATISVTDPILGIQGITKLFAMVVLKRPGEDWVAAPDEKTLFVTMPKADQVAVVDSENFKVTTDIDAGNNPVRIALQPDGKYLWVGNDSEGKEVSGVTVIDRQTNRMVTSIPTGTGHHEIAVSNDSLHAFVTNSVDGTLSVIDIGKLAKIKDIRTGELPVSAVFSELSRAVYVANGLEGTISVVDGKTHEVIKTVKTSPGLMTFRFAPGGRFGFAANVRENQVTILDASDNSIAHTVPVGKGPDQISFTKAFAYVRQRAEPYVTLIPLDGLDRPAPPGTVRIPAGQKSADSVKEASVAEAIYPAAEEGHALIANPADGFIFYYMEGMTMPMGSFQGYGRIPRAVRTVARTLKETTRGAYTAQIRIPAEGNYDVAFMLHSPFMLHCFQFAAERNPVIAKLEQDFPVQMKALTEKRDVKVKEDFAFRFELRDFNDRPREGLKDVFVKAVLTPGSWFETYQAAEVGNGVYEVALNFPKPGIHYLFFKIPSLKADFAKIYPVALNVLEEKASGATGS